MSQHDHLSASLRTYSFASAAILSSSGRTSQLVDRLEVGSREAEVPYQAEEALHSILVEVEVGLSSS